MLMTSINTKKAVSVLSETASSYFKIIIFPFNQPDLNALRLASVGGLTIIYRCLLPTFLLQHWLQIGSSSLSST